MEVNSRIVLIGAGNMATSLAMALKKSGNAPVAIWSRTLESASALGNMVGCAFTNDFASLPDADTVIISVADSALRSVARSVASRYPGVFIMHTAGSIPMSALCESGASNYGVLYPMQTMSKSNIVPFDNVTIFVEGRDEKTTLAVEALARQLSGKVVRATSEQRCYLHVAAVFACNFPNAVYHMASRILEENGLPFDAMLPLIDEAARKVHLMSPLEAQTGPAKREDNNVMEAHKAMLDDDLKEIYDKMSNYIMKRM